MSDARIQGLHVGVRQAFDGLPIITEGTVNPLHPQHAFRNHGDHLKTVQTLILKSMLGTARCVAGCEHRIGSDIQIHLSQIIETHFRCGKTGKFIHQSGILAQMAQQTVSHTFVRYRPQLLLHRFDQSTGIRIIWQFQNHRKYGSKPAHSARRIRTCIQFLPTMPFQIQSDTGPVPPFGNGTQQGGKQHIIDLGAIGGRNVLEQGLC